MKIEFKSNSYNLFILSRFKVIKINERKILDSIINISDHGIIFIKYWIFNKINATIIIELVNKQFLK